MLSVIFYEEVNDIKKGFQDKKSLMSKKSEIKFSLMSLRMFLQTYSYKPYFAGTSPHLSYKLFIDD